MVSISFGSQEGMDMAPILENIPRAYFVPGFVEQILSLACAHFYMHETTCFGYSLPETRVSHVHNSKQELLFVLLRTRIWDLSALLLSPIYYFRNLQLTNPSCLGFRENFWLQIALTLFTPLEFFGPQLLFFYLLIPLLIK